MGGRTALRVAGDPSVRGVVALAPWLPRDEPVGDLAGRSLVIGHGSADRITDPSLSRAYASRAHDVADRVTYRTVPGETHALLMRPGTWNTFVAESVRDILGLHEVVS
jgi:dienelactone hydrolase